MAVEWVFTQVIEPLLVVHVESGLEKVVDQCHPLDISIVSFPKRSEGFLGFQCALGAFIREEQDHV